MYVCVCNAVTEKQIRSAVAEGVSDLDELKQTLGVATCCGQCEGQACSMLGPQRGASASVDGPTKA